MRHVVRFAAVAVMLASATASRAGYERASWGMPATEVKRLFPGGKPLTLPDGAAAYRIVLRPFNVAPAIATFAFHPEHRLNVVVFEFPDGSSSADESDYPRPTREKALAIRVKLEAALHAKYGEPTDDVTGIGGSIKVWRGRDDLVRMQRVFVADGKEDLRLWVEDGREKITPTVGQKGLEIARNRTDPSGWSEAGALGVRWGMGVGDVLEKYPALVTVSFAESRFNSYRADAELEGSADVQFDFFNGMLCAIGVSRFMRPDPNPERRREEQLERFEEELERWRERVLEVLTGEYGEPIVAPSPRKLSTALRRTGPSDLAWQWKAKETVVTFTRRSAREQVLRYENIGSIGRAAYEAQIAHDAEQEQKRRPRF